MMKTIGVWDFKVYNLDNELQRHCRIKNQITNLGAELFAKSLNANEAIVRARLSDGSLVLNRYAWAMVFGTSNSPTAVTNISLGSKVLTKYNSDDQSELSKSGKTFIYTTRVETDEANGYTLREAGIYDRGSTGVFLSRVLINPVITKTSSNWFNATATISFT